MNQFALRSVWRTALVFTLWFSGFSLPSTTLADLTGCATDTFASYSSGFTTGDFSPLINVDVDESGYLYLETGNQAINPNSIVIPFEQEVWVSFFYEDAGFQSTLGWLYTNDGIDPKTGAFAGWTNIAATKKHALFRRIADGTGGGNGILDVVAGLNETQLAAYNDGTGTKFAVDGDGEVTPKDMRKSLGVFAGGTELTFFLMADQDINASNKTKPPLNTGQIFYTKKTWNPDIYGQCVPPAGDARWVDEAGGLFYRTYLLGSASSGTDCTMSKGLLDLNAITRLSTVFGLTMDGEYHLMVDNKDKFDHVIVAAPKEDPNQWILSWEDLAGGGDMDFNDTTFRIERKTGGTVQLDTAKAIIPTSAEAYYTAATFEVIDSIPGGDCAGKSSIEYELSIDRGVTWLKVSHWDQVKSVTKSEEELIKGGIVADWIPGTPEVTHRTARVDFAGEGLSGRELLWRAILKSDQEDCVPKIMSVEITGDVAVHSFVSRSSPIKAANVLYSASFETPAMTWAEKLPRGHVQATRLYDPKDPSQTSALPLWDAGEKLNSLSPNDRKIYFPDVTVSQISGEVLGTGDGETATFTGTLAHAPVLATTLTITVDNKKFVDQHTDTLTSDWGNGSINRFTGVFEIVFNTPPAAGVPLLAEYSYYTSNTALQEFKANNVKVTNALLGLDDTFINPTGYLYDLDKDGSFDENEGDWLVEWVRGFANGDANTTQKAWKLGPIDHSTPAVMTPPGRPLWYYGSETTKEERTAFDEFMTNNEARDAVLFVGARDGMLHAFDAGKFRWGDNPETSTKETRGYFLWDDPDGDKKLAPNYGTGKELWAFIPANLLPRLKNNLMQGADQAFVDASPALADVYINDAWRTVLLSAEGNGGDTVFCLDVTNPTSPQFLWEFADPDLFRSRSSPAVGKIGRIRVDGNERWAAFFVSGKTYDNALYPSVYIIDIANGSVIDRVFLDSTTEGVGGVPSGQPSLIDSDGNGFIDRLYVGTDKGRMYKINLSDDPDTLWNATSNCVINGDFTDEDGAADTNGNPMAVTVPESQRWHPIYASPTVVVDNGISETGGIDYNVRIFFGTGDSPYFDEDIDTSTTTYHFFAYNDKSAKGECSTEEVELDWFFELPAGARVFAAAFSAAGKIYFGTATSETENPCDGTNDGKLYVFDTTGYSLENPAQPETVKDTGDITTAPTVDDQHVFFRSSSGTNVMGGGYENQKAVTGEGKSKVIWWKRVGQ